MASDSPQNQVGDLSRVIVIQMPEEDEGAYLHQP